MTFAVSKRLEHELFHKREKEVVAALTGFADPDARAVISYELAEAVIATIKSVYEGRDFPSVLR